MAPPDGSFGYDDTMAAKKRASTPRPGLGRIPQTFESIESFREAVRDWFRRWVAKDPARGWLAVIAGDLRHVIKTAKGQEAQSRDLFNRLRCDLNAALATPPMATDHYSKQLRLIATTLQKARVLPPAGRDYDDSERRQIIDWVRMARGKKRPPTIRQLAILSLLHGSNAEWAESRIDLGTPLTVQDALRQEEKAVRQIYERALV